MAITTRDGLINALANNSSRFILDKASLANQLAGTYASLWRATGRPAQGAIPTTAEVLTNATTGAIQFANQTAPMTTYLAYLFAASSNSAMTLEIHDRIAHMGGLVLNTTSPQTVSGMDLDTLAPPSDRVGSSDYRYVQWWLEVYADGGATASNATINVTFHDGTTGNLNTVSVGGTIQIGRCFNVSALRTTAQQSKNIRGINSVTLSASTGGAGNVGFTCTRPCATLPMPTLNISNVYDWAQLGLPEIPNDSCLFPMVLLGATSTGTLRGGGKLVHG